MRGPQILVVDDEADIRVLVQEILAEEGYDVQVAANAEEAREARLRTEPDLVLLDIWMPDTDGITLLREWTEGGKLGCPVVMMSGHGTVDTAMEATRLGALDFVEKPLSLAKLLRTVENAISVGRQEKDRTAPRQLVHPLSEPVGKSRVMQALREQVRRVAQHSASVLLIGEVGTGRETLARYLHSLSSRAAQPFVNVVLSGLDAENAALALFGSDTGDAAHAGFLEQAAGGTLYLNELGDMVPEVQRLLLAALETGTYQRVKGSEVLRLDCRIVASTQPDFDRLVEDGRIRRDLISHLDVVRIRVPALRDYREDVPELIRYYADALVDAEKLAYRRFSVAAQNRLRNYPWPGNVRELKNMVHRFLLLGGSEDISLEEVEALITATPLAVHEPLVKQDLLALPLREAREHFERAYLEEQLLLCGGRVGKLAERVGMERTHLYRKLNSLGIDYKQLAGEDSE